MRVIGILIGALLLLGCGPESQGREPFKKSTRDIAWIEGGYWSHGKIILLETEPRMECISFNVKTLSCRVVDDDYPGLKARK